MDIESTKNPRVKHVRAVRNGDDRKATCIEGSKLAEEALDAGIGLSLALVSPKFEASERGALLLERIECLPCEVKRCSDAVLAQASGVETPQGIIVLGKRRVHRPEDLARGARPFIAVVAAVRDPGNVGAIVRSAEAAGASGFVALQGSADPWKDKALRASAGSIFRLPSLSAVTEAAFVDLAAKQGWTLVATEMRGGASLWDMDCGAGPLAFCFGAEGSGLPQSLVDRCSQRVHIPMADGVESLNVSVAASLVLFEMRRRNVTGAS